MVMQSGFHMVSVHSTENIWMREWNEPPDCYLILAAISMFGFYLYSNNGFGGGS